MYFTYILKSIPTGKFYIGSTSNLEKRLERHNKGGSLWTKRYKPWIIVFSQKFNTRSEAIIREKEIKNYKGGNEFKELINLAEIPK